MDQLKVKHNEKVLLSGVITVINWTMVSNGLRYIYFYCDRWEIITDKMMPVEGFKSSEHWQLAAMNKKGDVIAIFPGCQVKAWIFCQQMPEHKESDCYYLR